MRVIRSLACGTVVLLTLAMVGCVGGRSLDSRLVHNDWETVLRVTETGTTPELKIIHAHAQLRMNQPDAALCVFSSLTLGELQSWDKWTVQFLAAHPRSSVAHYLRGDALARLGRTEDALAAFTKAIAIDSRDVMAFDARGVLKSLGNDWNGADNDFSEANAAAPSFADVLLSSGTLGLSARRAADGALESFRAASKLATTSALARSGVAYAELALGQLENGQADLTKSVKTVSCATSLVASNMEPILKWMGLDVADEEPDAKPGMTIDRDLTLLRQGDPSVIPSLARNLGHDPSLAGPIEHVFDDLKHSDPVTFEDLKTRIQSAQDWTRPGGGAETLLNLMSSFGAQVKFGDTGPSLSVNPGPLLQEQKEKTRLDYQGYQTLGNGLMHAPDPVGGATSSLAAARYDRGDWPYVPVYALSYGKNGGGQ